MYVRARRSAPMPKDLSGYCRAMDEEVVPGLYVEDAAHAVAWYGRLGVVKEWEHQFEPGFPWVVSVKRSPGPRLSRPCVPRPATTRPRRPPTAHSGSPRLARES